MVVGLWVIYLPEHSACIEQMLKQFPICFNASRLASSDVRDETSVVVLTEFCMLEHTVSYHVEMQ
jgi:hypothetical protein